MAELFAMAADARPAGWWMVSELAKAVEDQGTDGPLFSWLDLESRSGRTRFGLLIRRYAGRILSGVRMRADCSGSRTDRHRYQFVRETGRVHGDVGDLGDVTQPLALRDPEPEKQTGHGEQPAEVSNVSTVSALAAPPRRNAAPEGTCPTCWHRYGRAISAPRGGEPCARCGERLPEHHDTGLPEF
jgi:hypothetical protein